MSNPSSRCRRVSYESVAVRPGFINGIAKLKKHEDGTEDYQVNRDATHQEMRTYVCAQCHVEYYFAGEDKEVTYPWSKGLEIENIIAYYDEIGFSDWTHGYTGGGMLKAQHPEFELYSQGTHAQAGVACADCHMPYIREGARKVSDHHVRSPLLNIPKACQTCHNVPEEELRDRAHRIQDRTSELIDRAAAALVDMMHEAVAARESGATDEQLAEVWKMQREAQFRLDYVFSENSHGFHADQESARILGTAIDYARRGQLIARELRTKPLDEIQTRPVEIQGITPADSSPPGPHQDYKATPETAPETDPGSADAEEESPEDEGTESDD